MNQMTLTKKNQKKLGSENVSDGTFGTGLGGLSHGLAFPLCVKLSADESCDNDGGSLALLYRNIGEAGTRECTRNANIFSIAVISSESWIDMMFVK